MSRSRRSESSSRSRSRSREHRHRRSSKRDRRSHSRSDSRGRRDDGKRDRSRSRSRERDRDRDRKDRGGDRRREENDRPARRRDDASSDRPRDSHRTAGGSREVAPVTASVPAAGVAESKGNSMFEIMGQSGLGRRGDRAGSSGGASGGASSRPPVWGNAALEEPPVPEGEEKPVVVEKANFGLSGALAKDVTTGNVYNGVVLKWSEPLDAASPDKNWRLFVFKGDEVVETLHLHRQSAYLIGREEKVADLKVLNPSCSKQHAVIQFRRVAVQSSDPEAPPKKVIKPYIMDLESTNKTFLNGSAIEPSRYIELREKDILKFGTSAKEYVLVCEKK